MLSLADEYAAYCLDSAVTLLGNTLEAELARRRRAADYELDIDQELSNLLDPDTHLPRPLSARQKKRQTGQKLQSMFGKRRRKPG